MILGDSVTPNDSVFEAALADAGVQATVIEDGTVSYQGDPDARAFSAVYVSPGLTWNNDMPSDGQAAIADAVANSSVGLAMTEWVAYQVNAGRYQALAPFLLLERTSGVTSATTISGLESHPIFYDISLPFTTTVALGYNVGDIVTNGGLAIARCAACSGPALVVRDAAETGRVVQLSHAADYDIGSGNWTDDPNVLRLTVNSIRWAAGCL